MDISITLGNRIKEAERLPMVGNLEDMSIYNKLRQKFVGFGEQQMIDWRIVAVEKTFVTALPNTTTRVTLDDDLVVEWAKMIRRRSQAGLIAADEANLYKQICDEADRIIEEASNENQDGE